MDQHYHHFIYFESDVLQNQLNFGEEAKNAFTLGQSPSTVSREVQRNCAAASLTSTYGMSFDVIFAYQAF